MVIGCSEYDQLREKEGYEGFQDIPEAIEDLKVVKAGLRRLGFAKDNIKVLENPNWMEIKLAMNETVNEIIKAYMDDGLNTLLFVYYAGHGAMDNTTKAILNTSKPYPLEKALRNLAKSDGSYVMGVFDCCREKLSQEQEASRGGGGMLEQDDGGDEDGF